MGTSTSTYMTGGGPVPGTFVWDPPHTYVSLLENKSTSGKRARPIGINMLFQGTNVSSTRRRTKIGTYTKTELYVGAPGGGVSVVAVPYSILGNPDFGLTATVDGTSIRKSLIDTSVNLAQAFAERKQTAEMFTDFGGRLIRSYKALRKGDVRRVYSALSGGNYLPKGWKRHFYDRVPNHVLDLASDSWLAWQYGVRPLVNDLAGSMKAYLKARGVQPLIRKVNTACKSEQFFKSDFDKFSNLFRSHEASLSGRSLVYAEFQTGGDAWTTAQQLGLTNPALLAWELIPYSFVVDWFLNVGDFLEASQVIKGLVRAGIHVTSTYTDYVINTQWGGSSQQYQKTKTRSFGNSIPGPTLNISRTPFGATGDLSRVFSGLALIRQIQGRFPSHQ